MQNEVTIRVKPNFRWLKITCLTFVGLLCAPLLAVLVFAYTLPPLDLSGAAERSVVVVDRSGRLLRPFTTAQGRWRLPVEVSNIDERYLKLLISYEDKRFYSHMGVDALAIMRSGKQWLKNGRITSGGSTLTMQVARLLEPRSERTLSAKLRQMIRAVQLEWRYSKTEILSLYLVLAPYGGNIEGLRAASLTYFGKEPKRLSLGEAALLVALPQAPESRRPDRYTLAAKKARNRVLEQAQNRKLFILEDGLTAQAEPVIEERKAIPNFAPQVAETMRLEQPQTQKHQLSIDINLQTMLETLARERATALGPSLSVAIMVANNATGEVLASVGGADYFSKQRAGSLDLTRAIRSPGSALKPFIYALAFEEGLAHPETILEDRPSRYGLYAPENFDLTFQGSVSARYALQMSLNVPAVDLLSNYGSQRFLSRLKVAGANIILPDTTAPGLSVGLGGLGITLHDLTQLYVSLARSGDSINLNLRLNADFKNTNRRLVDPVAAWYVADILRGAPPPVNAPVGRFAFKTGTSYGYRDAWAVGFDKKHTVGVWVGRPDGASVPGLVGRVAAAPILFDAFGRVGIDVEPFAQPLNALVASNANLPPPLRHTRGDTAKIATINLPNISSLPSLLKIAYPPDGAMLDIKSLSEGRQDIIIKAQGGVMPLIFLIDGKPVVSSDGRRQVAFTPSSIGFSHILVMDANGATDSVRVRVQ
jgi:penicillin-binding protein 1C